MNEAAEINILEDCVVCQTDRHFSMYITLKVYGSLASVLQSYETLCEVSCHSSCEYQTHYDAVIRSTRQFIMDTELSDLRELLHVANLKTGRTLNHMSCR